MIIKDIQLINFGKFNHKTISFQKGLNIVYGENEAGKTTIHTFIRGMLFGIEKQRGKASGKDIYSKYEPWDNPANYQGMMRIEQGGVNYRIERNFSRANKSFKIINEDLGYELKQDEIDKLFTGLDEGCYYNTISISQLGSVTDKELESILKNYAANLGTTKSMEIDIKEAILDLDSQKRKIIAENKVADEEYIIQAKRQAREQLETVGLEQQEIIHRIEAKKREAEDISYEKKDLSAMDKKRLEELAKQNERKDKLYQDMVNYTADVEKFASIAEQITNRKKELEEMLVSKNAVTQQDMDELTDKILNKTNMPIGFILIALAFIGGGIGFILGNFELIQNLEYMKRPAICFGIAIICFILAGIRYVFKKKGKQKKLEELREIKSIREKLEAAKNEEIYAIRQLDSKKEALVVTQELIRQEDENSLDAEDYSEDIRELEIKEREINEIISKTTWALEQKKETEIEIENHIEELNEKLDRIKAAKVEVEAIEQAKANIEVIAEEIRSSFGKKLNELASKYMSKITNGKYDKISIDEHLNITINSRHSLIAASKLSKGTVEQIYMALRLAAAEIIFENDPKPILLDDAFVMYDNKRMGNTMRFMADNMNQVIVFSCHSREKVMADKLQLNHTFLNIN